MGDTVVKGVKDVTIWLGEISFLPNDESSAIERFRYGMYKATLGKLRGKGKADGGESGQEALESDCDIGDFQELHPGLVKLFTDSDRKQIRMRDLRTLDRLAKSFAETEAEDEETARAMHDRRAEGKCVFEVRIWKLTHLSSRAPLSPPSDLSDTESLCRLKAFDPKEILLCGVGVLPSITW